MEVIRQRWTSQLKSFFFVFLN